MKLKDLERVWALTVDCRRLVRPDDPEARWTVNLGTWDAAATAVTGISHEGLLGMISARLEREELFRGIYLMQSRRKHAERLRKKQRQEALAQAARHEERERRKFMKAARETAEEEWEWIKAARGRF